MISVTEAKNIIRANATPLSPVTVPLQEAAGMVLAADVYARTDIPAFNQSAMDGYAISFEGWQLHKTLNINGEIPAGESELFLLQNDQAIRIFTGAPVPSGAVDRRRGSRSAPRRSPAGCRSSGPSGSRSKAAG